ncbi:thioredoxin-like domain-containing protein [Ditylenchus destructor]|nr:thioredoxin-like domain-containing protein [Ditylenchus destructor]
MNVDHVKRWCTYWKTATLLFVVTISRSSATVTPLDSGNIESILANNQVVFVNFYADWCRFSQHLKPIFEEASKKFVDAPVGQVAFASVDCDRNADIAQKYHVNKYPTLKLFRFGELIKKEYRGQRSAVALAEYIEKQTESKIQQFNSKDDLNSKMDNSKRNIIAYFTQTGGQDYKNLQKIGSSLQDDCAFWIGQGDWVQPLTEGKGNIVAFKSPETENEEMPYAGPLDNYENLNKWISDKCIPIVREITFENAEELTEEGVPFLILFRSIGDTQSEKIFSESVSTELWDQRGKIFCSVLL